MKRAARAIWRVLPFKRGAASLARLTPLPWSVKRNLLFSGPFRVRVDRDHSFRVLMTGGSIERDLFFHGYGRGWEATSLQVWQALARSASTIMDIGANLGTYALAAASVNPSAKIVAFEPLERIHDRLVANVALNKFDIVAERVAVSDATGSAPLYDAPRHDFHGASLIRGTDDRAGTLEHVVSTTRLDDYCREKDVKTIDLLKIDIEGHEAAALRGMGALLEDNKPTMLVEVLTDEAGEQVWHLLEPLGYVAYRVDEGRGLMRTANLGHADGAARNYLLYADSTIAAPVAERYIAPQSPAENKRPWSET